MDEVAIALRDHYVDTVSGYLATLIHLFEQNHVHYRFIDQDVLHTKLGVAFLKGDTSSTRSELEKTLKEILKDGTIICKSTKDVGTIFKVELTFKKDLTPIQKESKPENVSQLLVGKKVLLVEDNELNMKNAAFILEEKGMCITQPFNGQIALDLFKNSDLNEFSFILMDIMMPIMNGLEATRQIRCWNEKMLKLYLLLPCLRMLLKMMFKIV